MQTEWRFPTDVPGWLSEEEGRALASLATDKDVLEIGSFKGRSTICMAQTARHVHAVDPFDGRMTQAPGATYAAFKENLERYGLTNVTADVGCGEDVVPGINGRFDVAFIDGAHDFWDVFGDADMARKKLVPGGGRLAFHDYRRHGDDGVTFAVDTLIGLGARLLGVHGTVAILDPVGLPAVLQLPPMVALAMPSNRNPLAASRDAFQRPTNRGISRVPFCDSTSALPFCFNLNWCAALNARRVYPLTHFAMIHDDVCPEGPWLDVLMDELDRTGADVVSAVVPIKSAKGLTSTAVDYPGDQWRPRRIVMNELFDLPETFGAEDVPWRESGACLLANTGLWVCKFGSWCEKLHFRFQDRVALVERPDGAIEYVAQFIPEDWDFSRRVAAMGKRVVATRKVKLYHERKEFHNHAPWGTYKTDVEYIDFRERVEKPGQPTYSGLVA